MVRTRGTDANMGKIACRSHVKIIHNPRIAEGLLIFH